MAKQRKVKAEAGAASLKARGLVSMLVPLLPEARDAVRRAAGVVGLPAGDLARQAAEAVAARVEELYRAGKEPEEIRKKLGLDGGA